MPTPELDLIIYNPRLQSHATQSLVIATAEHIRTHCGGALGFFPMQGFHSALARDRMLAAACEQEACLAFILWTKVRRTLRILAIGVEEDFRRLGIGSKLIEAALATHRKDGIEEITLRCREDLPATKFWENTGFAFQDKITENNKKGVALNRYLRTLPKEERKDLADADLPDTLPDTGAARPNDDCD